MKSSSKKIGAHQLHWFIGVLCVLIIIAVSVVVNEISLRAGIIMGGIIVVISPGILWLSNMTRKHDDNIHYHDEGSQCYKDEDAECREL
jgi:hypothetical protein